MQGELFQITLAVNDIADLSTLNIDPIKSVLTVHRILGPNQRTQIINGQRSASTSLQLVVSAKQTGNIVIPSLNFNGERSQPIRLKAVTGSYDYQKDVLFLQTQISTNTAYLDQPITVRHDFFYALQIEHSSLNTPSNVNLKQLKANESRRESIDGVTYQVQRLFYSLTPDQAGTMDLSDFSVKGLYVKNNRYLSFEVESDPLNIEIKPIPSSYPKGIPWLPAENVVLNDNFNDGQQLNGQQSLTREIRVELHGLNDSYFKELTMPTLGNASFYADKQERNTIIDKDRSIGIINNRWAFIPEENGQITLPEISITWWDVTNDRIQLAVQTKTIDVQGVKQFKQLTQPITASNQDKQTNLAAQELPTSKADVNTANNREMENQVEDIANKPNHFWLYALFVSIALNLLFATALIWLWQRQRFSVIKPSSTHKQSKIAKLPLKACQQKMFIIKTSFNDLSPTINSTRIRCGINLKRLIN